MTVRKISTLILLIFGPFASRAQELSTLQAELPSSIDTHRVRILHQLSDKLVRTSPDSALSYAREGYSLARSIGDDLGTTRTGTIAAAAYRRLGHLDSAISICKSILPVAEDCAFDQEELYILHSFALCYLLKANYDTALFYLFRSLNHQSSTNDSLARNISLNNIGLVYYKLKQYDKALKYFLESHEYKRNLFDTYDLDILLINISLSYAYLEKYAEAERYVQEGLRLCEYDCRAEVLIGASFAKGVIAYGLDRPKMGEEHFLRSYSLARSSNDVRFLLDNSDYLSKIYMERNDFNSAAFYLMAGEQLTIDYPDLGLERSKIYLRLFQLYRFVGDFKAASDYQLKYIELQDNVYSHDLTSNLMKLEAEHLERENLARIASQNDLIALNHTIIKRQRLINLISTALIIVSLGLLISLFNGYRQKEKINKLLGLRFDERTRQLLISEQRLIRTIKAQIHEHHRMISSAIAGVKRLKALSVLGLNEHNNYRRQFYVNKIHETSDELQHSLSVLGKKNEEILLNEIMSSADMASHPRPLG